MSTFVRVWEERMNQIDEELAEQTALSKLVWEADEDIFDEYYNKACSSFDGINFTYMVFPCERYNYTSISEGINREENRILHFKSDRHQYFDVSSVINELEKTGKYVPNKTSA
ncbi:hypothetical protein [Haloarcula halobia]|nr:hypothetical protein [Halomicroarcula sp. XH51]